MDVTYVPLVTRLYSRGSLKLCEKCGSNSCVRVFFIHRTETDAPAECLQEIKSSNSTNLTVIEASAAATIDCNRYSSLQRLLRVTAYVKWLVHNTFEY